MTSSSSSSSSSASSSSSSSTTLRRGKKRRANNNNAPQRKRREKENRSSGRETNGGDKNTVEMSEYEMLRLKNIERNRAEMAALGIDAQQTEIKEMRIAEERAKHAARKKKRKKGHHAEKGSKSAMETVPLRRSSRRRTAAKIDPSMVSSNSIDVGEKKEDDLLMNAKEYWSSVGVVPEIELDGHYRGWVEETTRVRLGIECSAADAWDANGGGKFRFGKSVGGGRSSAKESARKMLHKNPNQYFYRHCAPGVEQWFGDWTEDETQLFIETAKKHGCGDKWGLFSTYIPHRVGYQCSQHYRYAIIGTGIAVDPSFSISTVSGNPVFVGKRRGRFRK